MPIHGKCFFHEKKWIIRDMGSSSFINVFDLMKKNNNQSKSSDLDELWLVEHPPTYTLGLKSDFSHLPYQNPWSIPIVQCDRGGQITYHAPGQIIVYIMMNLDNRKITTGSMVRLIEKSICDCLFETYDLEATTKENAPGVYISEQKIASIGLRIRNNRSYHGLSLNFNMDLTPFNWINPCGYKDLKMTNISHHRPEAQLSIIQKSLIDKLIEYIPATC